MAEEEKDRGFKVADRRRFSAEGEAKPEAEERPAPLEQAASAGRSPATDPSGVVHGGTPHQASAPSDEMATSAHSSSMAEEYEGPSAGAQAHASAEYQKAASLQPGAQDAGPQDLTFASFVVGLSTEALALMGEMPHPATGERMNDLVGAQQLVDIIGILQEKTRGNLSADEETLLEAILFELRMKYVEKARRTPR
jgi:uncharacterized protein DUF1844